MEKEKILSIYSLQFRIVLFVAAPEVLRLQNLRENVCFVPEQGKIRLAQEFHV